MGSHVRKKQMEYLGIAHAKELSRKDRKDQVEAIKDDIKGYVGEVVKGAMSTAIVDIKNSLRESSPQIATTDGSNFASNSIQQSQTPHVAFSSSPTILMSQNPLVNLNNSQGKELEKGYVVTDSTAGICHGKKVGIGEKTVYITEVFQPDEPLWFSRDGRNTFSEYVCGGYMIWLEAWMRYV